MLLTMIVSPLTQGWRQVPPREKKDHWPDRILRKALLDLPDELFAFSRIGFHRLLIHHIVDLRIAIPRVVAL